MDEKTVLLGRVGPTVMLPRQGAQVVPLRKKAPLRVDVAGGGPVGLAFACTLKSLLGDQALVRVHDRRWMRRGDRVVWRGAAEGNNRREQVVTLQSNVWAALPSEVRQRLFTPGKFSEMWPLGPDSPESKGRPRNIKIRWIEDALLDMAQDVHNIELVPAAYVKPDRWDGLHVLAIADGAKSATRDALSSHFGTPSRELFSVDGSPLDERVLGIRVTAKVPDEHTVPLTVGQNRFLFNSLGGGFINMRLTAEEASEIVALGENGPVSCIGRFGCTMRPSGTRFVCDRHRAVFKPSVDKLSYLWPRILDGLRFFGVGAADVVGINSFTLGMQQMSKFTAQLAPSTFGFLLGDAANSLHFWPGRGLNTGLKSALSLAVNLQKRWRGSAFRAADFAAHEGIMQQLQYREKSRAWTTMLMPDSEGVPRGIEDRIRTGLEGPFDRDALVRTMFERVLDIKKRLGDRMGSLATDEWYYGRINALDVRTLKVMVESGAWITREIGGEEVVIPSAEAATVKEPVRQGLSLVS
jgi:2-polyprenyl-6-methoxyphenol hydroxylase-like FAD-dependent oxidoreductase